MKIRWRYCERKIFWCWHAKLIKETAISHVLECVHRYDCMRVKPNTRMITLIMHIARSNIRPVKIHLYAVYMNFNLRLYHFIKNEERFRLLLFHTHNYFFVYSHILLIILLKWINKIQFFSFSLETMLASRSVALTVLSRNNANSTRTGYLWGIVWRTHGSW